MVRAIGHEEINSAGAGEIQLVEVLPRSTYEQAHLPNAESIPLTQLDRNAVAHLNPAQTVVVYCADAY